MSDRLKKALSGARRVAVFTGAGISAESGVPTFRGNEGIWKKFKPEELATFSGFRANPELVWEWYRLRKEVMTTVRPNAGHMAIVSLERFYRVTVITQNVDNLHRRAGSSVVRELHGNIERNYCTGCGKFYTDAELRLAVTAVPRCPKCSGTIRPDVVWFGELLPGQEWNASVDAARRADIFFCVGTSGVVYPAASLPSVAKQAGALVVEINVEPTDLTPAMDESLFGAAGEVLPRIVREVESLAPNNMDRMDRMGLN
ncbi:MAG TPA: NAD-dependent deacylase [Bacteroidota bacterium]|nr:NAD-dependent deacylase [Bacteroidota bacterium]